MHRTFTRKQEDLERNKMSTNEKNQHTEKIINKQAIDNLNLTPHRTPDGNLFV